MSKEKQRLVSTAAELYRLGLEVEAARARLRKLVEQGVSYESAEMRAAFEEFTALDRKWKALEREHLSLRGEVIQGKTK